MDPGFRRGRRSRARPTRLSPSPPPVIPAKAGNHVAPALMDSPLTPDDGQPLRQAKPGMGRGPRLSPPPPVIPAKAGNHAPPTLRDNPPTPDGGPTTETAEACKGRGPRRKPGRRSRANHVGAALAPHAHSNRHRRASGCPVGRQALLQTLDSKEGVEAVVEAQYAAHPGLLHHRQVERIRAERRPTEPGSALAERISVTATARSLFGCATPTRYIGTLESMKITEAAVLLRSLEV